MGPGEERRTARIINGRNGRQMVSAIKETAKESRRRKSCCDVLMRKPSVKMRTLGLSPSSGNLPDSRSMSELEFSMTTPQRRRSKQLPNGHRFAAVFHGNDNAIDARPRAAEGSKVRGKSNPVVRGLRFRLSNRRLPCRRHGWPAVVLPRRVRACRSPEHRPARGTWEGQ